MKWLSLSGLKEQRVYPPFSESRETGCEHCRASDYSAATDERTKRSLRLSILNVKARYSVLLYCSASVTPPVLVPTPSEGGGGGVSIYSQMFLGRFYLGGSLYEKTAHRDAYE